MATALAWRDMGCGLPERSARQRPSSGAGYFTERTKQASKSHDVLVVAFSTTISEYPIHIRLTSGQTGLPETSELQPEQIAAVRKEYLRPRPGTRMQTETVIRTVAKNLVFSLGIQPKDPL